MIPKEKIEAQARLAMTSTGRLGSKYSNLNHAKIYVEAVEWALSEIAPTIKALEDDNALLKQSNTSLRHYRDLIAGENDTLLKIVEQHERLEKALSAENERLRRAVSDKGWSLVTWADKRLKPNDLVAYRFIRDRLFEIIATVTTLKQ